MFKALIRYLLSPHMRTRVCACTGTSTRTTSRASVSGVHVHVYNMKACGIGIRRHIGPVHAQSAIKTSHLSLTLFILDSSSHGHVAHLPYSSSSDTRRCVCGRRTERGELSRIRPGSLPKLPPWTISTRSSSLHQTDISQARPKRRTGRVLSSYATRNSLA